MVEARTWGRRKLGVQKPERGDGGGWSRRAMLARGIAVLRIGRGRTARPPRRRSGPMRTPWRRSECSLSERGRVPWRSRGEKRGGPKRRPRRRALEARSTRLSVALRTRRSIVAKEDRVHFGHMKWQGQRRCRIRRQRLVMIAAEGDGEVLAIHWPRRPGCCAVGPHALEPPTGGASPKRVEA